MSVGLNKGMKLGGRRESPCSGHGEEQAVFIPSDVFGASEMCHNRVPRGLREVFISSCPLLFTGCSGPTYVNPWVLHVSWPGFPQGPENSQSRNPGIEEGSWWCQR